MKKELPNFDDDNDDDEEEEEEEEEEEGDENEEERMNLPEEQPLKLAKHSI